MKPASKRLASRQQTDDDTDPAIGRMLVSSWQSMTPCARLARAVSIASAVDLLARAGARARSRPGSEQWMTYAEARLGRAAAVAVYGAGEGTSLEAGGPMDHLAVLLRVVDALNRCGIDYVVGGSLASSMSGEPRATVDVDLMIDLSADRIRCLVNALGEDFYAEEASLARAVRNRSHANVVHRATVTKIDLFIMGATPIEPQQMRRRRLVKLETIPAELYVYTPEDILLQKLRWFRLGGEVSDRQWQDVQGIVAVQGERLDLEYLRRAAEVVGVGDLLERVLRLR
ncbi:MAG TPA: nucleotidyl transferase AbiEii/AbiGii toxin family protein [Vicinamibacterales bacterium]